MSKEFYNNVVMTVETIADVIADQKKAIKSTEHQAWGELFKNLEKETMAVRDRALGELRKVTPQDVAEAIVNEDYLVYRNPLTGDEQSFIPSGMIKQNGAIFVEMHGGSSYHITTIQKKA